LTTMSLLYDHHKQLIQYFLHDGALNQTELIDLIVAIRDRYDLKIKANDEVRTFINVFLPAINKQTSQYGIEIKQVISEEHENDVYFVCTQNFKPQFVKMDMSYTEKEAAVYEKLLELVITSDEKSVAPRTVFEAILANDLKMTQKEFSETMARFHRDKWIESGPDNTVILHARTLLEMQAFITDLYQDFIYNCQICTRLLLRGFACSNNSCDIHMHRSCGARYFLNLHNNKKTSYPCPTCKHEWNKDDVNSVLKAATVNDENNSNGVAKKKQRTSNTSNTSINGRPVTRRHLAEDDDDDN